MRISLGLIACLISLTAQAGETRYQKTDCPQALPTSHTQFCSSFADVARCHCSASLPQGLCQDVNRIYDRMIQIFGSIEGACNFQKDTETQTCIDDWICYRTGGKDSAGNPCSGTGKSCM